jgi:hypothetical protein
MTGATALIDEGAALDGFASCRIADAISKSANRRFRPIRQ